LTSVCSSNGRRGRITCLGLPFASKNRTAFGKLLIRLQISTKSASSVESTSLHARDIHLVHS